MPSTYSFPAVAQQHQQYFAQKYGLQFHPTRPLAASANYQPLTRHKAYPPPPDTRLATQRGYPDRKLRTCRYWAFGKQCPNTDVTGLDTCDFAHWDTGILSTSDEQRGTCAQWLKHRTCHKGTNCYYEHRDTGYTGLYQGQVELSGLNRQIANAAANAGFNTAEHDSLFNLIWSVRKVVFAHGVMMRTMAQRPPPHPIYPDRFRPSGVGDNTKRKRKTHDAETVAFLKYEPITGTQESPITLSSEDEGKKSGIQQPPKKRRRGGQGNKQASRSIPPSVNLSLLLSHNKEARDATVSCDQPISPLSSPVRAFTEAQALAQDLASVKGIMADVSSKLRDCQEQMHIAFETYRKMRQDEIADLLWTLSDNLKKGRAGVQDGLKNLSVVAEWAGNDGGVGMIE